MSDLENIVVKKERSPRVATKRSGAITKDAEVGREEKAHGNAARPKRVPIGQQTAYVDYPEHLKDPNFFYYFVADQGGNVERRKMAGYEFVYNEDGTKFTRMGKDGINMICMRQRQEDRDEDLELKRQESSAIMKAEQKLQAGEYLPDDRTSKMQKDSDLIDPMLQ